MLIPTPSAEIAISKIREPYNFSGVNSPRHHGSFISTSTPFATRGLRREADTVGGSMLTRWHRKSSGHTYHRSPYSSTSTVASSWLRSGTRVFLGFTVHPGRYGSTRRYARPEISSLSTPEAHHVAQYVVFSYAQHEVAERVAYIGIGPI